MQKSYKLSVLALCLSLTLITPPTLTLAQEEYILFEGYEPEPVLIQEIEELNEDVPGDESGLAEPSLMPSGTDICFDYYTFGSVQANLTTSVTGAVAGTPMTFSGTLENNNRYPIVDGALFVKVFKSRGEENDGHGPDLVDQFFVESDISIPANGSVPVIFEWMIPGYTESGEYSIATFFTSAQKFNLLGLSFTDDIVGNTIPFTVTSDIEGRVSFDKTSVTVNDRPHFFAAALSRASADEPVLIEGDVTNTTDADQIAIVDWTIYQWDAQREENLVQESSETISVPAGDSSTVSVTIEDSSYPVYLAIATLRWQDSKSIIGVRFMREGIDRPRINSSGVTSFPLVSGEENTLFSCFHNSSDGALVDGGRLEVELKGPRGNTIHQHVYEGGISTEVMGVADKFVPARSYDRFTLLTRLYQDEELIDEAELVYDCNSINPNLCSNQMSDWWNNSSLLRTLILGAVITGIVIITSLIAFRLFITSRRSKSINK